MRNPIHIATHWLANRAHPRSPQWPAWRRLQLIRLGEYCHYCGSTKDVQLHHIMPFHLKPEDELNPDNVIPLCETLGVECHYKKGHNGTSWQDYNPNIKLEANSPGPGTPCTLLIEHV